MVRRASSSLLPFVRWWCFSHISSPSFEQMSCDQRADASRTAAELDALRAALQHAFTLAPTPLSPPTAATPSVPTTSAASLSPAAQTVFPKELVELILQYLCPLRVAWCTRDGVWVSAQACGGGGRAWRIASGACDAVTGSSAIASHCHLSAAAAQVVVTSHAGTGHCAVWSMDEPATGDEPQPVLTFEAGVALGSTGSACTVQVRALSDTQFLAFNTVVCSALPAVTVWQLQGALCGEAGAALRVELVQSLPVIPPAQARVGDSVEWMCVAVRPPLTAPSSSSAEFWVVNERGDRIANRALQPELRLYQRTALAPDFQSKAAQTNGRRPGKSAGKCTLASASDAAASSPVRYRLVSSAKLSVPSRFWPHGPPPDGSGCQFLSVGPGSRSVLALDGTLYGANGKPVSGSQIKTAD
jgi:hypothetical protein